jgi:uncharacterized protein (TIGR02266 family)
MSKQTQVPTLADIQRAESELAAQDQRLEAEVARQASAASQLGQSVEQLSLRAKSLAAGGADVGAVAAGLATVRVPPLELGPHVEAGLRARWAAVQARREAGTALQQLVAVQAASVQALTQQVAAFKGMLDAAEGALRAKVEADAKRAAVKAADEASASAPTIRGEVIRPELMGPSAGLAVTVSGPVAQPEEDLPLPLPRVAAPPPAPEGYEATGVYKAPVPAPTIGLDKSVTPPAAAPPAAAGPKNATGQKTAPGKPVAKAPAAPNREKKRVRMDASVDLESETNFFTGFSTDISEGGLFVATVDLLPIGSEIDLRFTLPSGRSVDVHGVVRWRREVNDRQPEIFPGMGVQFRALEPAAASAIQQFVGTREPLFFPD